MSGRETDYEQNLSELLRRGGGEGVSAEVWEFVYRELRVIARRQLFRHATRRQLSTTGLVHEAYLHLHSDARIAEHGRAYFFGAAARAMRQILVDHARRSSRSKRGGGQVPVTLTTVGHGDEGLEAGVLDVHHALERFERLSPRPARVVECRFFAGLTVEETAAALSISPRTVKSDWALARAWLRRALETPPVADED